MNAGAFVSAFEGSGDDGIPERMDGDIEGVATRVGEAVAVGIFDALA